MPHRQGICIYIYCCRSGRHYWRDPREDSFGKFVWLPGFLDCTMVWCAVFFERHRSTGISRAFVSKTSMYVESAT